MIIQYGQQELTGGVEIVTIPASVSECSGPMFISPHSPMRGQEELSGNLPAYNLTVGRLRHLFMLRFSDGALMKRHHIPERWDAILPANPDWVESFRRGYSVPCCLFPFKTKLGAAWHIPHLGKTVAAVLNGNEWLVLDHMDGAVEQLAWSNPMNYRGSIQWLAVSDQDNQQHVFRLDESGRLHRGETQLSDGWLKYDGRAHSRKTQLNFGGRLMPHNERLHYGTSTLAAAGECCENPVCCGIGVSTEGRIPVDTAVCTEDGFNLGIEEDTLYIPEFDDDPGFKPWPLALDHRMFLDILGDGVYSRVVENQGSFKTGESELEPPYNERGFDYEARTMIAQVSFKGQMFYLSVIGMLHWQDDYHFIHRPIFDLSRNLPQYYPPNVYSSPVGGSEKQNVWEADTMALYSALYPYDFLCRIDVKSGELVGRHLMDHGLNSICDGLKLNSEEITGPEPILATENGVMLVTDPRHVLYFAQTDEVVEHMPGLPTPIADQISYPYVLMDNDRRHFYVLPPAIEFSAAFALAGCCDNSKNVSHPATTHMFEFNGQILVLIVSGTWTRPDHRPPAMLAVLNMEMGDLPYVAGFEAFPLTENGVPLNASGMVPVLDEVGGTLHIIYEDPELKVLKHLSINLYNHVQTYHGVVSPTDRPIPLGFKTDIRSAVTQGCALDYDGDEPFAFVEHVTLDPNYQRMVVDYRLYSPDSRKLNVQFRHALGTLDRSDRRPRRGFVPTTGMVQDPRHQVPESLASSPDGVYHTFVHNLIADEVVNFFGEIQYELHPETP